MYFDIGANTGRWSDANSHMVDKIIAVEASPNVYKNLQNNLQNKTNIECLNYAVCANEEKEITFYESDINVLSTLNKDWLTSPNSRFYNTNYKEIICPTITLDKLITIYGIPQLIKIDVEGSEYTCIQSLTQKVENLCFEWASELNDMTFLCLDYLYSIGFKEFCLQFEDHYTYRPSSYTTIDDVKNQLKNTTPKIHWGMVWCR